MHSPAPPSSSPPSLWDKASAYKNHRKASCAHYVFGVIAILNALHLLYCILEWCRVPGFQPTTKDVHGNVIAGNPQDDGLCYSLSLFLHIIFFACLTLVYGSLTLGKFSQQISVLLGLMVIEIVAILFRVWQDSGKVDRCSNISSLAFIGVIIWSLMFVAPRERWAERHGLVETETEDDEWVNNGGRSGRTTPRSGRTTPRSGRGPGGKGPKGNNTTPRKGGKSPNDVEKGKGAAESSEEEDW